MENVSASFVHFPVARFHDLLLLKLQDDQRCPAPIQIRKTGAFALHSSSVSSPTLHTVLYVTADFIANLKSITSFQSTVCEYAMSNAPLPPDPQDKRCEAGGNESIH